MGLSHQTDYMAAHNQHSTDALGFINWVMQSRLKYFSIANFTLLLPSIPWSTKCLFVFERVFIWTQLEGKTYFMVVNCWLIGKWLSKSLIWSNHFQIMRYHLLFASSKSICLLFKTFSFSLFFLVVKVIWAKIFQRDHAHFDGLICCCEYKTMGPAASCSNADLTPDGSVMTVSRTMLAKSLSYKWPHTSLANGTMIMAEFGLLPSVLILIDTQFPNTNHLTNP